jgi:hypothetical protein
MKPNINSVEVHQQLSYNGHPLDGAWMPWWVLVHCGPHDRLDEQLSLWMSHGRQHTWEIVDDGIGNMVIGWDRTKC